MLGFIAAAGVIPAAGMADDFSFPGGDDVTRSPVRTPSLFGSHERVIGKPTELFPDTANQDQACKGNTAMSDSLEMLNGLRSNDVRGQIAGVNKFINGVVRINDITCNIKSKPWAAPIAYLKSEGGAEDYAVAKYVFLRKLGFHYERLRVVWVGEDAARTHNAVLAVILDGQTLVLENHSSEISDDRMLPHYHAYCSVNEFRFALHWDFTSKGGVMASLDRLAHHPRNSAS
ncbi:MAG: hypothetical protein A3G18_10260 [Rhodospirillales bacterium RIFCSPLOWO2_12_FULL_58_28]|nr:MAG: hypothetical protein A3H92_08435 [Rhodospirillales bacterium RIFCSPLOWO2_02_FULL_58_16]OHC77662.1 MAG: hypothetical protein A3G18_10260 [Rhodospirillales bacterium RIFCSPLOWO2_12_FULL_58_28]